MNMKFVNETSVTIEGLTEQKMGANWIMMFSITTQLTKEELETLLTESNISTLEISDGVNTETITGYSKITVATIIYRSNLETIIEVQLRKE